MQSIFRLAIVSGLALSAGAGPAFAMPIARTGVAPTPQIETVAYRRHVARATHGRVYRRHYGSNAGAAAFVGAAAGLIGAGIAASQQPTYSYGPGYGYPYGGYDYGGYGGYGYPYNGW